MNRRVTYCVVTWTISLASSMAVAEPAATGSTSSVLSARIIPAGQMVEGQAQGFWARKYLDWIINTRLAANPNYKLPGRDDPTAGRYASVNNDGPVVFLPTQAPRRTITIPPNRPLLVPVIWAGFVGVPGGDSCNGVVTLACAFSQISPAVDQSSHLSLTIDGVRIGGNTIRGYRQTSTALTDMWLNPYPDNVLPDVGYKTRADFGYYPRAVAIDGYYVFLDRLSVGKHELRYTATLGPPYLYTNDETTTVCVGVRTNVQGACDEE